jgi:hypothetical protein
MHWLYTLKDKAQFYRLNISFNGCQFSVRHLFGEWLFFKKTRKDVFNFLKRLYKDYNLRQIAKHYYIKDNILIIPEEKIPLKNSRITFFKEADRINAGTLVISAFDLKEERFRDFTLFFHEIHNEHFQKLKKDIDINNNQDIH